MRMRDRPRVNWVDCIFLLDIWITIQDVKQLKMMLFLPSICMPAGMKHHIFHMDPAKQELLLKNALLCSWLLLYVIPRIACSVPVTTCTKMAAARFSGFLIVWPKTSVFTAVLFYAVFCKITEINMRSVVGCSSQRRHTCTCVGLQDCRIFALNIELDKGN